MKLRALLTVLAFGLACIGASAQDKKPGDKPAEKPATPPSAAPAKPADKPATPPATAPTGTAKPADTKGGMPPDMQAGMGAMMEESKPGKEHDALKPLAGSFTCTTKMYMMPGAPPSESTATVDRKWILGNRYMTEEVKGAMPGMGTFEGYGVIGYDKLQKNYHAYWVDSMGTGTYVITGNADPSGKTFTFSGENFNPMLKQKTKSRSVTEIVDPNKHTMKMYENDPTGKENLVFEMTCTKK